MEEFMTRLKNENFKIYKNLIDKKIEPVYFLMSIFITLGTNIIPLEYHIILYQNLIE